MCLSLSTLRWSQRGWGSVVEVLKRETNKSENPGPRRESRLPARRYPQTGRGSSGMSAGLAGRFRDARTYVVYST